MAEVRHHYVGKVPSEEEEKRQAAREKLDAEWKRKRIAAEAARQRLHEAKLLAMKGELISRAHVQRQSAFLVLSLRARLLALPGEHARELLNIGDERTMQQKLDVIVRSTLEVLAEMPSKVTDPNWMQKAAESGGAESTAKRPRRDAK